MTENAPKEINYPEDFIKKCKDIYPDWTDLHKLLDGGKIFAGRYLDDASHGPAMSNDAIIEAFANGTPAKVLDAAKKKKQGRDVYADWGKIYDKQIPKKY